jgi:hypothetical protein
MPSLTFPNSAIAIITTTIALLFFAFNIHDTFALSFLSTNFQSTLNPFEQIEIDPQVVEVKYETAHEIPTLVPINCSITSSELKSLEFLYNSTSGKFWDTAHAEGRPWHFPATVSDPCTENWLGLTCEYVSTIPLSYIASSNLNVNSNNISSSNNSSSINNCFVKSLYLRYRNLVGTISPEISGLYGLVNLTLANNYINGSIPASISNLTRLNNLVLTSNFISGSVPSQVMMNFIIEINFLYVCFFIYAIINIFQFISLYLTFL